MDHLVAAPPAPQRPQSADVIGIPLALTTYDQTLDWIDAAVEADHRGYICVAATHTVMAAQEDPALRKAVLGADFTVPDGQPLVWALRAFGHRLPSRVYGPTLMEKTLERGARTGQRFYLYGGRNGDERALAELTAKLRERFPGVQIVGGWAPVFRPLTDEEADEVAADINASGADVVWVGLGVPRQEKWMADMRPRLDAPVLIGVGAAFDFHAGLIPQAPAWIQTMGMEWAFRLAHEPRRLWRRYTRYNPRFVVGFGRQWLRLRFR